MANNKQDILFRFEILAICFVLVAFLVLWFLYDTTVTRADAWNKKAANVQKINPVITPERGKILADNGTVLAANLTYYDALIDFKLEPANRNKARQDSFYSALDELSQKLADFRKFDKKEQKTAAQWKETLEKEFRAEKNTSFVVFKTLTYEEYLELKKLPFFRLKRNVSGFYSHKEVLRAKPYGSMASQSIGSLVNVFELTPTQRSHMDLTKETLARCVKYDEDTSHDKWRRKELHGRTGLEGALDSLLFGRPGVAKKVYITSGTTRIEDLPAIPGSDITTTINVLMQDIAESELQKVCYEVNAEWGTVVLMEVATGEIKAISNLEWGAKQNRYYEGVNHAVRGYEPGSVIKPISMMIALEDGLVTNIDQPIATGKSFLYCGRYITDSHGATALSARQVIESSSNIGMSKIMLRGYEQDPGKFYDRLKKLGFFDKFNSGIAGEGIPRVRRLSNTKGDRVALTRMVYGYTTEIPPLSTLAMYNAIANDGKFMRPHLVKSFSRQNMPDSIVDNNYLRDVCSAENARKLRMMLHDVVWGEHGTARAVRDDLVEIAGKTGTAFRLDGGKYNTSVRRLCFCGFFPYDKPKYSCIVLMSGIRGVSAARSSGKVLKEIARKLYAHGLLGNESNYKDDSDKNKEQPKMYASMNPKRMEHIKDGIGGFNAKTFNAPQSPKSGVPNVRGLNVRDAVALLERAGLTVRFSGSGYVAGQSIPSGTAYKHGDIINLVLRH